MKKRRGPLFIVWLLLLVLAASVVVVSCARVLGLRKDSVRPFEHRAHVVAGVTCVDCHAPLISATSTTAAILPTNESCLPCHEKPHDPAPCRDCHGLPGTQNRVEAARKHLIFAHRDHLPAVDGNCARCHERIAEDGISLLPTMATCLGCHEHRGEYANMVCDRCHEALEEEHVRPESHIVHDMDFTERHSIAGAASADLCATCHSERDCAACHGVTTAVLPDRLVFDQPQLGGLHRANFRARHALEASTDPGSCFSCHREESCRACHDKEGVGFGGRFASPHPPGWVGLRSNDHGLAARRDPVSCAACHGGAGEILCVDCHRVGAIGGNPHPPGFSNNRPRGERPCVLCHL